MISNKTATILLFITMNMQLVASTSPRGTKRRRSPVKSALTKRQKRPSGARGTVLTLQDTTDNMNPVEVQDGSTEAISISQELSAPQVNNQFKTLIEQGEYEKIFEIGEKMNDEEFLNQLCPVIETPVQYKGVVKYLKRRKMVASYYIHGNIEVVKGAIVESSIYDINNDYFKDGDLEAALPLALEKDSHDRFVELLDVRREITAENDEQRKLAIRSTSFEWFVRLFLMNLAPWEDGISLRRFLILRGEELSNKYRDIMDTLCEHLVCRLSDGNLHLPKAKILLEDLIVQPSLLTPVTFAKLFLFCGDDVRRSTFIKYGWCETVQEGLKMEYWNTGKKLWQAMQTEQPDQFLGEFPDTEEARAAVCAHLPTKQQKEKEWIKKYFKILFDQVKNFDFLPTVLWSIISEYAVLFIATMD